MARCAGMCCNPSTLEPEASRSHRAQGQPGKHSEFQTRLCYVVRPCLKKRREGWRGAGKGREKKSFHASKYCFITPRYRSHSDYGPEHYLSPPSLSVGERAKDWARTGKCLTPQKGQSRICCSCHSLVLIYHHHVPKDRNPSYDQKQLFQQQTTKFLTLQISPH